jgi:DNA-binding transcriptional MerR regulator
VRIGELAIAADVSTKTIRYYEKIGVLAPPDRATSGYRAYDETTVDRLRFIRAAQAVGLTLGEIRSIVALRDHGETPCTQVMDLITARAAELDQRINELQRLRADLDKLARRARRLDPANCDPRRICHLIGPDTADQP